MAPESGKSEKRVYPRKTLRTQVVFKDELGEDFLYFYSTDISLGGIFLESDIPLPTGTAVSLSFYLPEGDVAVETSATVVRHEKDHSGLTPVIGMGVQFQNLSEAHRRLIEHFISDIVS